MRSNSPSVRPSCAVERLFRDRAQDGQSSRRARTGTAAGRDGGATSARSVADDVLGATSASCSRSSAIWGSSFLFIKVGVEELEPAVVVLGRLVVGALRARSRRRRTGWRSRRLRAMLGAARRARRAQQRAARLAARLRARRGSTPGLAAVIQAAAPIFTVAPRVPHRPVAARHAACGSSASALGFVGVALLVGVQEGGELARRARGRRHRALLRGLGALRGSRDPLASRRSTCRSGSSASARSSRSRSALAAAARRDAAGEGRSRRSSRSGALGTGVAYLLYFALIARAGASRAILVTYLVPAFALVYGVVFLDEPVTASALAGLALILGGTTLATGGRDPPWVAWPCEPRTGRCSSSSRRSGARRTSSSRSRSREASSRRR